jgi:hypothetical protein
MGLSTIRVTYRLKPGRHFFCSLDNIVKTRRSNEFAKGKEVPSFYNANKSSCKVVRINLAVDSNINMFKKKAVSGNVDEVSELRDFM